MMTNTVETLKQRFTESPILRATSVPTPEEVEIAENEIGIAFPPDYRQFLLEFGGAMVGPYPIFGLRSVAVMGNRRWSVVEMTRQYRQNKVPGCDHWIVMSEDHSGNPVGIDANGKVWIHDHDFGGIERLAESFEQYIRVQCLNLPSDI